MTERPLIRSAAQVKALLAGATQVRVPIIRAVDPVGRPAASVHLDGSGRGWIAWWPNPVSAEDTVKLYPGDEGFRCPLGAPGDRLYCRETHAFVECEPAHAGAIDVSARGIYSAGGERFGHARIVYAADDGPIDWEPPNWRPSTQMPRWAARLILEVIEVRAQKLGEVTSADAIAEGATSRPACTGYMHRDEGWSMDWSRAGQPSKWAGGKPALDESDIALGSPVMALANAWDRRYAKRNLAWSPDLWTFVATCKRVSP